MARINLPTCEVCDKGLSRKDANRCRKHVIVKSSTRRKLSKHMLGNQYAKGHSPANGFNKGYTPWNKGKAHIKITGENNHNWNGGSSKSYKRGYKSYKYRAWREAVFQRDEYTCKECGAKGYITAHHIKSFAHHPELTYEIDNGKTLCELCHTKTDNYKGRSKGKKSLVNAMLE